MTKLTGGTFEMKKLIMLLVAGFILYIAVLPAMAAVEESSSPEFKAEVRAEMLKLQQEVNGAAPFTVATVPQRTPVRAQYMSEYLKGMTAYQSGNFDDALEHLTAADAIIQNASGSIQVK